MISAQKDYYGGGKNRTQVESIVHKTKPEYSQKMILWLLSGFTDNFTTFFVARNPIDIDRLHALLPQILRVVLRIDLC